MKLMAAMLFLVSLTVAAAEPPAGDAGAALLRLMAVLPGTWKTEGATFDSLLTKAGPQHYTTRRDCWQGASDVRCVSVVNGTLQLYDIFTWDAQQHVYEQSRITPQGRQPEFRVSAAGSAWSYDQDVSRPDGSLIHYRVIKTYASAAAATYSYAYSLDGKQWTEIAKGQETRLDAGK